MHQMGDTMLQLGNKIQILENERRTIEETARKLSMQLAETDMTRYCWLLPLMLVNTILGLRALVERKRRGFFRGTVFHYSASRG